MSPDNDPKIVSLGRQDLGPRLDVYCFHRNFRLKIYPLILQEIHTDMLSRQRRYFLISTQDDHSGFPGPIALAKAF